MPQPPAYRRIVDIYVKDARRNPVADADISFYLNGEYAGKVPNSGGHGSIRLPDRDDRLAVSVTQNGNTQRINLAQDQDSFTFDLDINRGNPIMEKHLALFVGIFFVLLALILGFTFGSPTVLQNRLILGTWSLACGAIATEISGMIKVDLTLGKKIAIGATGALAVFVILYLVKPA